MLCISLLFIGNITVLLVIMGGQQDGVFPSGSLPIVFLWGFDMHTYCFSWQINSAAAAAAAAINRCIVSINNDFWGRPQVKLPMKRACVACASGYYGVDCQLQCRCDHESPCDAVTGRCNCTAGWMGQACDQRQSLRHLCILLWCHCVGGVA